MTDAISTLIAERILTDLDGRRGLTGELDEDTRAEIRESHEDIVRNVLGDFERLARAVGTCHTGRLVDSVMKLLAVLPQPDSRGWPNYHARPQIEAVRKELQL